MADAVAQARSDLEALRDTLAATTQATDGVKQEFTAEVQAAADDPKSEVLAKGLIDSTREVVLTVSETVLAEARSGRKVRDFVARQKKTGQTEWPKLEYWAIGVWVDWLARSNPALRNLTRRFPAKLKWLNRVLDYLGFDPDP